MSKQNRQVILKGADPTCILLAREIEAPDKTGTYVMIGVKTFHGNLSVITSYRSLEALAAALTRSQNAQMLLEGTAAGEGL